MKRILFIATVVKMHIMPFHIPYLEWFKKNGYEVHVCARNDYETREDCKIPFCDKYYDLPFKRSPFKWNNKVVYNCLKEIIDNNSYDIVHCHTPMGGAITRLAARNARKKGTKVIYTAHGFHFYSGAPLKNWILYYPVEKWLSKYTDCLITINEEDYNRAIKSNFKANSIHLVHGVGIDINKFNPQTLGKKNELRKEYGINNDDFILFYAAELNYNKHQDLLINVINLLKNKIPNIKLLLAGNGNYKGQYEKQVRDLGLQDNVKFLGFRKDISNLLKIADIAVASSRREGLPVNVMEAMATGLPLVVTDCRGNRDLVSDGENGYVVGLDDAEGFANAVWKLYVSEGLRQRFGRKNLDLVKKYSLDKVKKEMEEIYSKYLGS